MGRKRARKEDKIEELEIAPISKDEARMNRARAMSNLRAKRRGERVIHIQDRIEGEATVSKDEARINRARALSNLRAKRRGERPINIEHTTHPTGRSSKRQKHTLFIEENIFTQGSTSYNVHVSDEMRRKYAKQRREERKKMRDLNVAAALQSAGENNKIITPKRRRNVYAQDKYSVEISYYGLPEFTCKYCEAIFWRQERVKKNSNKNYPIYSLCCKNGKVRLDRRKEAPEPLKSLLDGTMGITSDKFQENIRAYNSMFSMTSMGAKVDSSINNNGSVYVYKISGQNYHRIGSMLPKDGSAASFLQLYVYDTENEIQNRLNAVNRGERNEELSPEIIKKLIEMLNTHNELVKIFRSARDWYKEHAVGNFAIKLVKKRANTQRLYSAPTASEIAMLIVGDMATTNAERDLIIQSNDGVLQRISDLHPLFMALQYPLLFPFGEDGFHLNIPYVRNTGSRKTKRKNVTTREYYAYVLQQRNNEGQTLQLSGRLFQQYIVDSYTQLEQQRLRFLRKNQANLRTELYRNAYDAIQNGDSDSRNVGMRTILPASFTGSPRYMVQNYQDAMAICRVYGNPDFFITFTANPNWKEVKDLLNDLGGQKPENRPDIESRVFKLKLDEMIHDIVDNEIFGKVEAVLYTIEFQKRGLPHAHIIFWVNETAKLHTNEQVDLVISAEIPDPSVDPVGYDAVSQFMIHGPCGCANSASPCMVDGICSKKFPKSYQSHTIVDENGYCVYRRRDQKVTVEKNGVKLDNRFVVPYNRYLVVKYQSHINVEACNKSTSIKYLFKYVTKGPDRSTIVIANSSHERANNNGRQSDENDEIKTFLDCRYISACEAVWRIFEFPIHCRKPAVERLCYHLEGEQLLVFNDHDPLPRVVNTKKDRKTMFTEWMEANKVDEAARSLTYAEFPTKYVWKKGTLMWKRRESGKSIGRLIYAHPSSGERYYLRLLLNIVKGSKNYEDIKKFNGVTYPTMKMACYARGLLEDDGEWHEAIEEAMHWASGRQLRDLFLTIILFCDVSDAYKFWESNWHKICDDILHMRRRILRMPSLSLNEDEIKNLTLAELQKVLLKNGRSLEDIQGMPLPDKQLLDQLKNRLIMEEQSYDTERLSEEHRSLHASLNAEQLNVYEKVVAAVEKQEGKIFFLYGYGGTGKTYLYTAIINKVRAESKIVLAVASSGIAALLLPGGRTAHSRFRIPLNVDSDSTCPIKQNTQLASLIQNAALIIWDEAPMDSKYAFEAVDKTLKDILRGTDTFDSEKPFGGKTILMGGDFRQILPVIPAGTRGDIVSVSLNSSYLWNYCELCVLTQNMRLQSPNMQHRDNGMDLVEFSNWTLRVGEGREYSKTRGDADEPEWIKIPEQLLLAPTENPIENIFQSTYPDFMTSKFNTEYLTNRAILTPRNEVVEEINSYIMNLVDGEMKEYYSYDTIDKSSEGTFNHEMLYPMEFLNSLRFPGIPNYCLQLKIGVPIMLLRNVNPSQGMCNGTRLIITQLGKRVIEATIISGSHVGERVMIPRITLTGAEGKLPFILKRRQFPVRVCYAMTINKSQGQTLENVGLYLPQPVFSHGQLYVAISRVKNPGGLKILSLENDDEFKGWTKNVVYREIFNNLC